MWNYSAKLINICKGAVRKKSLKFGLYSKLVKLPESLKLAGKVFQNVSTAALKEQSPSFALDLCRG